MKRIYFVLLLISTILFSCDNKDEELVNMIVEDVTDVNADSSGPTLKSAISYNGTWKYWLASNTNGTERAQVFLEGLDPFATGIRVKEQGGYGIVNLSLIGKTEKGLPTYTDWTTTNFRGSTKQTNFSSGTDYAKSIQIKEQGGYGIIDARLISQRGLSSGWVTGNNNQDEIHTYNCDPGYKIVGVSVREQSGYGVVDVKIYVKRVE